MSQNTSHNCVSSSIDHRDPRSIVPPKIWTAGNSSASSTPDLVCLNACCSPSTLRLRLVGAASCEHEHNVGQPCDPMIHSTNTVIDERTTRAIEYITHNACTEKVVCWRLYIMQAKRRYYVETKVWCLFVCLSWAAVAPKVLSITKRFAHNGYVHPPYINTAKP